ncbi:MAG: ABC transporter ATP-binding protein [Desulfotomaculaceae bacterium]|nr:ABC transporter ATP-binding protein [Desulfotomaculaceae bacterium]
MSDNIIIEAKNLNLTKGKKKVLDIEHFCIEEGEAVALIGPNGAGKSTLMQVLMLLQRPTGGELYFKGERVDWKKPIAYRRRMAMVFQESLLLDTTVYHNVASGMKLRGFKVDTIPARVNEWLQRLGIAHLAERQSRFLSGGESQRVSLARALVLEPEVLFLDEPFVALDVPTRAALTAELARILRDTRITSVFVTHDYSEVPLLAETVVVLEQGRIIQIASPREVMTRPVSSTVASLVGVENMIPGKVVGVQDDGVLVQAGPHRLKSSATVPVGTDVLVLLRPEDIRIFEGISRHGDNSIAGKVRELLPHSYLYKAVVDCGFRLVALVNPEQVMGGEVMAEKEITIQFSPDKVHLIKQYE